MSSEKKSKKTVVQQQFEPLSQSQMREIGYNFTPQSEIVAKYVIEKLISLTVTNYDRNVIDQKIPNHCFEFFHRIFNDALQAEYIAYDRDDIGVEKFEQTRPIFFDNKYNGFNDWSGLCEPKSSKIDRAASTYIKVIKSNPLDEQIEKKMTEHNQTNPSMPTHPSNKGGSKNPTQPLPGKSDPAIAKGKLVSLS